MRTDEKEMKMAGSESKTLYVVFHGELAFFDSTNPNDPIYAYAPEMEIHVYSAGPWLAEKLVPKGLTLRLTGVAHGKATVEDDPNLTVKFGNAHPTHTRRHMEIELPRPDKIFSGGRIDVRNDKISVESPQTVSVPSDGMITLALIFQYKVNGGDAPALKIVKRDSIAVPIDQFDGTWEAGEGLNGFYVLHVFAEADINPGPIHIEMASKASAALVGVKLEITIPEISADKSAKPPTGLLGAEVNLILADRLQALKGLGGTMQRGEPLVFDPPRHFGASSCGNIVAVPHPVKPGQPLKM